MRKPLTLTYWILILVLLTPALPVAAASPPLDVALEVPTTIPPEGPSFGPFTASGPAVAAGLICATGQVTDGYAAATGYQSGTRVNLTVVKRFTCDDGSGEFYAQLQVQLDWRGDHFAWVIVGGTGAYARLRGTGRGTGSPIPEGVLDLYTGIMHIS